MIKIGITGHRGFVGQHLYNTLTLYPHEFEIVQFHRDFFENEMKLVSFVGDCDVIVHLAAMNRHDNPQTIYHTNIKLVSKLIVALGISGNKPHILFASSSQEERDNPYGNSKKEGRKLLRNWCSENGVVFTGLVIPNVFGPFGVPYYNSFVATFCHQLVHNETPTIEIDGEVKLIYIHQLINILISEIRNPATNPALRVSHSDQYKVSEILSLLSLYKKQYLNEGAIPDLPTRFEIDLFNTFRSYINIEHHFPMKFVDNTDSRGNFVEIIRLNTGGQVSFSTTFPGITRGNHFHTRKIERFAVIRGKARIQLRRIGSEQVFDFYLDGNDPAYVDIPVWFTHNIKNIGQEELYTIFWINEFYDLSDPDTYFEDV